MAVGPGLSGPESSARKQLVVLAGPGSCRRNKSVKTAANRRNKKNIRNNDSRLDLRQEPYKVILHTYGSVQGRIETALPTVITKF